MNHGQYIDKSKSIKVCISQINFQKMNKNQIHHSVLSLELNIINFPSVQIDPNLNKDPLFQMTKNYSKIQKAAGFILKLANIVSDKDNQEVVSYNHHQRSFSIKNIRKFTQEVLPKYFKHRNYSSFVRQVNLYSFHKIPQEGKQEVYQNEFFDIKNSRELRKMKRKLMVTEKKRIEKRNKNWSQSQEQYDQSDNDSENQNQASKEQEKSSSMQPRSSDPQEKDVLQNQKIEKQIEEIKKRKASLQNSIRLQQMANENLQKENRSLRNNYRNQNNQFNRQLLNVLTNLINSQVSQGQMAEQTHSIFMQYINKEINYITKQETQKKEMIQSQSSNDKRANVLPIQDSNFILLIKELLTNNQFLLNVPFFIQVLKSFVENNQNRNNSNSKNGQDVEITKKVHSSVSYSKKVESSYKKQQLGVGQKVGLNNLLMQNDQLSLNKVKNYKIKPLDGSMSSSSLNKPKKRVKKSQEDEQYVPKY